MTKLTDTHKQVEQLKQYVEKFLGSDDDELIGLYEDYLQFKEILNSLLSPIAKYRVQLSSKDESSIIFGPKTRKTVEELVRHYDKVYELFEEHLVARFDEVTKIKELMAKENEYYDDDEENEISITEETKQDLIRIQREKELARSKLMKIQANLDNIRNQDIAITDPLYLVQQVYRNDPATSLEDILVGLHLQCEAMFLEVIQKLSHVLSVIAKHPDELAQRLMRITHEKLYDDIIRFPSAVALLKYAGFKIKHSDDLKEQLKQLGMEELRDYYFLYLKEPDMFTEYGRWKAWLDSVNNISGKISEFIEEYKLLMRTRKEQDVALVKEALSRAEDRISDDE